MGYLNLIPANQSRLNKEARRAKKAAKAARRHEQNLFFKERNESFKGAKLVRDKKIITVHTVIDEDAYSVHVSVDKNNSIYDITMDGFGRINSLYYALYGHAFVYDTIKEKITLAFKD